MARALAKARCDAVYSYAGRTQALAMQPLPTRIGGFGGAEGLAAYLAHEGVTHVIDATHPFAAGISRNAIAACASAGVRLAALERPGWHEEPGDHWTRVPDYQAAAKVLPGDGATVFLAIGRQNLEPFAGLNQRWLLRFAEPHPHPLTHAELICERGPFQVAHDLALMQRHGVTHVVAKNAGGEAARAKLIAARRLGLPVVMIDRPALPPRQVLASPPEVMDWLHAGTERGV